MSNEAAKLAHTLLLDAPVDYQPRPKSQLAVHVARELNEADMDLLKNPPKTGIKAPSLQRIRNTHHTLARLLAEGKRNTEISLITGFSTQRISDLKNDPMFSELVSYYKAQVEMQYLDVHARLADLGVTAVEEIRERLEQDPEQFTVRALLDIMKETLDRSSAPNKGGKSSKIEIKFVTPEAVEITDVLDLDVIDEEG